jgi:hypothetical protein
MASFNKRAPYRAQRGYALGIMLAMLVMGGLYLLLQDQGDASNKHQRNRLTAQALQTAKQALLSYAITYRNTHENEGYGYLPCPDMHDASQPALAGTATSSCINFNGISLGLLPYKTLGLPDLRDADGNCLWYAVSAAYRNNPKSYPLNWDTQGQISLQDAQRGIVHAVNDEHGGLAAVIIAPGPPLMS